MHCNKKKQLWLDDVVTLELKNVTALDWFGHVMRHIKFIVNVLRNMAHRNNAPRNSV